MLFQIKQDVLQLIRVFKWHLILLVIVLQEQMAQLGWAVWWNTTVIVRDLLLLLALLVSESICGPSIVDLLVCLPSTLGSFLFLGLLLLVLIGSHGLLLFQFVKEDFVPLEDYE